MRLPPAQVSSKLDKEDVEKIEKEVNDTISWLDANQLVRCLGALLALPRGT